MNWVRVRVEGRGGGSPFPFFFSISSWLEDKGEGTGLRGWKGGEEGYFTLGLG